MSVLDTYGMPPSSRMIEITEDLVVADFAKARTVLNRLREKGIRVAIDDFGSGYPTLTYLRELPADEVKLGREFIAPILHDDRAATIARSVIELAAAFGIATVAEGVGTAQRPSGSRTSVATPYKETSSARRYPLPRSRESLRTRGSRRSSRRAHTGQPCRC